MSALSPRLLWIWLLLPGCAGAPEPAGEVAETVQPLYQELYAGESGPGARQLGDRARVRIWLGRLNPDAGQQAAMAAAAAAVQAEIAAERSRREERDRQEQAALGPIYAEIEAEAARAIAAGQEISEVRGKALAAELRRAQEELGSAQADRMAHIRAVLEIAGGLLGRFPAPQQEEIGRALFFLRYDTGAELSPQFQSTLLGAPWDPASFASLRRVNPPDAPGPVDIGGLWSLDQGATDPMPGLEETQRTIILALALGNPALLPVLEGR